MEAIVQRSAGLDVHKKVIMVTVLLEQPDKTLKEETREYGTHYQACEDLADWLSSQEIELSVMESTGIFWKNIYAALEKKRLACIRRQCTSCKASSWSQDRCER